MSYPGHGHPDTNDTEHSGSPNSPVVLENTKKLHKLILADHKLKLCKRSWRYQKAVYSPFSMNICQWESYVQSGCCVCSVNQKQPVMNSEHCLQLFQCNKKDSWWGFMAFQPLKVI